MKNIKKIVLLFIAFFPLITICMQDCTHNETSAQVLHKDFMVCKELWSDFQEDFDFLHKQVLVDLSEQKNYFHNFLQDAFERNRQEGGVDIGRVHIDILDFLWNCVKTPFYNVLHQESRKLKTDIAGISDPIFLYVMHRSKSYFSLPIKEIINISDNDLFSPPLIMASSLGNIEMVKLLHDFGADVNIVTVENEIPLFCAIENNRVEVAKFLIDHGADMNAVHPSYGFTPLHLAIMHNQYYGFNNKVSDMISMLLKAGADINKLDKDGSRSLHYAALFYDPEIFQLLIDEGADLEALSNDQQTSLEYYEMVEGYFARMIPVAYIHMQLTDILTIINPEKLLQDPCFDCSELQRTKAVSFKYVMYLLESFDNDDDSEFFPFAHDKNLQVALYNEIKENLPIAWQQKLQSEHNEQIIEMLVTAQFIEKACIVLDQLLQDSKPEKHPNYPMPSFAVNNTSILRVSAMRYIFNKERKKYISTQRYKHFENQLKKDWR